MESSVTKVTAKLVGIRPILFDRYAGDNNTKLPAKDKVYSNQKGELVLPVLNIYSLLTSQNSDSVAARFYGKQRRDVALGINAFCSISPQGVTSDDMVDVPLLDESGKQYMITDPRITIVQHVGRMKKGVLVIPNPKARPMIPTGWNLSVDFKLTDNNFVSLTTLKTMVEQGGILGLGTFRPIFGRYAVEWIE